MLCFECKQDKKEELRFHLPSAVMWRCGVGLPGHWPVVMWLGFPVPVGGGAFPGGRCWCVPPSHPPAWQGLTQCCCYQLGLQLLDSQWHPLQVQVLCEDGAVHGPQSLLARKAHGEDAEVALQQGAKIQAGCLPPGADAASQHHEVPHPIPPTPGSGPRRANLVGHSPQPCRSCIPAAWSRW